MSWNTDPRPGLWRAAASLCVVDMSMPQCYTSALQGNHHQDNLPIKISKEDRRTRGHEVTLVKELVDWISESTHSHKRTINEWNKVSTDCVTASSVNMIKKKIDKYIRRQG